MRSRIAIALLPAIIVSMMSLPGSAGQERYEKSYVGAVGGGFVVVSFGFKLSPADINPGETNVAEEDPTGTLAGTPADDTPLAGTPLDGTPLKGTPADQNMGGVVFEVGTFKGQPQKLVVEDESGFRVPWSVCQFHGPLPCGQNAGDNTQGGCGTPPGGEFLAGIDPTLDVHVWIYLQDSEGSFAGEPCDGPSTTGTITLITKT